jgi:hypothetical protein
MMTKKLSLKKQTKKNDDTNNLSKNTTKKKWWRQRISDAQNSQKNGHKEFIQNPKTMMAKNLSKNQPKKNLKKNKRI